MSFPTLRPKRENGTGLFSGQRWSWMSTSWSPFLANDRNLAKATADGKAFETAQIQHGGAGAYELSIAPKTRTNHRVVVYIGAAASVRDAFLTELSGQGQLTGYLDHALKEGHCLWVRVKVANSEESAKAIRDKALGRYDYAWVQQPGAKARSLTLKPAYMCCCCCQTGVQIKEGAPKFAPVPSVKRGSSFLSGLSMGRSSQKESTHLRPITSGVGAEQMPMTNLQQMLSGRH